MNDRRKNNKKTGETGEAGETFETELSDEDRPNVSSERNRHRSKRTIFLIIAGIIIPLLVANIVITAVLYIKKLKESNTITESDLASQITEIQRTTSIHYKELIERADTLEGKITLAANAETMEKKLNQFKDALSNLETMPGKLNQFKDDLSHIKSRIVTACRVCFEETEGSSQCQGNRHTCSGWSTNSAWSASFRDDTDGRTGGCAYRWKLECLTGI